jgi:hypothetical protein
MDYIITRCDNVNELMHYGVPGMKWGHRKARYYETTGNGQRTSGGTSVGTNRSARATKGSSTSSSTKTTKKQLTPEQKAARRKKALKVGAAVAGTALAAYGTYKLAQHVSNKRNQAAMKKAQDYINENFMEKIGTSTLRDGTIQTHYSNGLHGPGTNSMTLNARGSKTLGQQNARVVATGRQMYKDATNTKLDRGLAKVVGAGNKVGDATRKAGDAVGSTARKVKNNVLDVVNPQYGYVPTTAKTTTQNINGMKITKSVQNYRKVKVKRR